MTLALPTSYENIEGDYVTVLIDDSTITFDQDEEGGSDKVGLAVRLTSTADTIETVAAGEFIFGKLILVEGDGYATVKWRGPMTLPGGTSHGISAGTVGLIGAVLGAAEGYVKAANPATLAEVAKQRGFCANAADATALAVFL